MADKKYYWLKLKRDFFKRHDIQIIEAMPNGKDYVLFYLKLLVESVDHDGELRFSDTIPYNEQMLSTITNTNVDTVRAAMQIFEQLNLIEVLDDQTIYLEETKRMCGSEGWSTERVRNFRSKELKALQCNTDVTNCNATETKSKSKSKSKSIELDKEYIGETPDKPTTHTKFIPPTIEEVKTYCSERNKGVNPEKWIAHYQANGWMVGRTKMKDWKAAVRTWEGDEKNGRFANNVADHGKSTSGSTEEIPKYGKVY